MPLEVNLRIWVFWDVTLSLGDRILTFWRKPESSATPLWETEISFFFQLQHISPERDTIKQCTSYQADTKKTVFDPLYFFLSLSLYQKHHVTIEV